LPFWGHVPTPGVNWREILHGQADPRALQPCQISHESVKGVAPAGKNATFRPVSKFKYQLTPLCGVLLVNKKVSFHKQIARQQLCHKIFSARASD